MPPKIIEVPGQGPVEFPESMSDDQIVAAIKANSAPSESTLGQRAGRVAGLGARSLVRGATAIPTMMAEAVYQPVAAAGRAMGVPPIPGFELSPSAALEQTMTRAGLPQPESFGERLGTNIGTALTGAGTTQLALSAMKPISQAGEGIRQAFMQRPAMQGVSAGTGAASATTAGELGAGPVGQMAAGFAGSMVPFVPGMFRGQQTPEALRTAEVASKAQDAGLRLPPSQVRPGFVNSTLEGGVAGKAATERSLSLKNQPIVNKLAKEDLGFPADRPMTAANLNEYRQIPAQPYREIAEIGPHVKKALEDLKQTRFDATATYKWYARQPDPKVLKEANALQAKADAIEAKFEQLAVMSGKPDLIDRLRQSRMNIAKSHAYEAALDDATGNIDANALARQFDRGAPLSGNALTIGKTANVFGPSMRLPENVGPNPGFSMFDYLTAFGSMGGAAATSNPLLMAGAAIPLVRPAVRGLIGTPLYQNTLGAPNLSNLTRGEGAGLGLVGGLLGNYSGQQPR